MSSKNRKFMQSLDAKVYREMRTIAGNRGITIQELIRATLVPTFLRGPIAFTEEQRRSFEKMRTWRRARQPKSKKKVE